MKNILNVLLGTLGAIMWLFGALVFMCLLVVGVPAVIVMFLLASIPFALLFIGAVFVGSIN
jgi:hypothetical protein